MEPDITNREERADPVASNAMDEKVTQTHLSSLLWMVL